MLKHLLITMALAILLCMSANAFQVDSAFPGGNIVVGNIEGNKISLSPDQRDSSFPWFYWCFRVTGAAGKTLEFNFKPSNIGVHGPGVSLDNGQTWKWLGADAVKDGQFSYTFPSGDKEVRFSVGMPYVRSDLDRFLARHQGKAGLKVGTLTKTPKGRDVPTVEIGDGKKRFAVAITSRHHCSEMMATRVVEGMMEGALADDPAGRWLRDNVDFLFVPFMDTDGVEDGDQGKNRVPHDHNRDYIEAKYNEVAAFKEKLPAWAAGRPLFYLDCHCPALKGEMHESVTFLEAENRAQAAQLDKFSACLERDYQGTILYSHAWGIMRFGSGYNKITQTPAPHAAGWVQSQPNALVACSLEFAYSCASGCEVNSTSAKEFGRDIAVALKSYLSTNPVPEGAPASSPIPQ